MEHFFFFFCSKRLHEDTISQLTLIENVETWNTDSMLPFFVFFQHILWSWHMYVPNWFQDRLCCLIHIHLFFSTRSVMFYMHGPIFVRINFADFYNRLTLFFFVVERLRLIFDRQVKLCMMNLNKHMSEIYWRQNFPDRSVKICFVRFFFFLQPKLKIFLFVFGWWSWIPRSRTHDERIWWLTTVQYNHFLYPDFLCFEQSSEQPCVVVWIYLKSLH